MAQTALVRTAQMLCLGPKLEDKLGAWRCDGEMAPHSSQNWLEFLMDRVIKHENHTI